VILAQALQPDSPQSLEFQYGGKRAIRKPEVAIIFVKAPAGSERPKQFFSARGLRFDLSQPENSVLVATGEKTGENHRWQHPRHHLEK